MNSVEIRTGATEILVDITAEVERIVAASGVKNGVCVVTVPHTTAGVTVNENADPDVRADILMALRKIVPDSFDFAHTEGNGPAHVKASIMGSSATLIVESGRLKLGTWQAVYLCEFDGPRTRRAWVQIVGKEGDMIPISHFRKWEIGIMSPI
jgi:secondary thiamine-phosphate synthase enzyme